MKSVFKIQLFFFLLKMYNFLQNSNILNLISYFFNKIPLEEENASVFESLGR